jgi:hypothetical protein
VALSGSSVRPNLPFPLHHLTNRTPVSGAILSNTLSSRLSNLPFISADTISGLTSSTYALNALGLTAEEKDLVLEVYMTGLHYIYVFYAACIGAAFVLCAGVGNTSLKRPAPQDKVQTGGESEVEQTQSDSDPVAGLEEKPKAQVKVEV